MTIEAPVVGPLIVVEDNVADWETISLLLREAGVQTPLVHCTTGEEALNYVAEIRADGAGPQLPAHILLDLNLPGRSGLAVLSQIRQDQFLAAVPVTILTTSSRPRDIESCYRAGANSYLTKPMDFERFEMMLRIFAAYWLDVVKLPSM